jgi:hypothetical protein
MRIGGNIPFNVARAYGVTPPQRPAPLAPLAPTGAPAPAAPVQRDPVASNPRIEKLVAGTVPGGVDFGTASTPTTPAGPYQLYTRAADKIEATVAVELGRAIDVSG